MTSARRLVGLAGVATAAYGVWVRPWLLRWGATDAEVHGPFPHPEVVPDGRRSGTMAVTIDAPPDQVWPWLLQIGWDRAGWYSWDHLDNAGRPSAREVHAEWQDLAVGDRLRFWAPGAGVLDSYEVAVVEPNRFLGLYGLSDLQGHLLDPGRPRPSVYMEGLWGFRLEEVPGGGTRLVSSGYQTLRPRWLERFFYEWVLAPVVWVMTSRMLAVIKRNVEGAGVRRTPALAT